MNIEDNPLPSSKKYRVRTLDVTPPPPPPQPVHLTEPSYPVSQPVLPEIHPTYHPQPAQVQFYPNEIPPMGLQPQPVQAQFYSDEEPTTALPCGPPMAHPPHMAPMAIPVGTPMAVPGPEVMPPQGMHCLTHGFAHPVPQNPVPLPGPVLAPPQFEGPPPQVVYQEPYRRKRSDSMSSYSSASSIGSRKTKDTRCIIWTLIIFIIILVLAAVGVGIWAGITYG